MAKEIHELVQQLGFKQVSIVGHDIGLMVAYAYAAQYPDEVNKVVLMDAFLPGVGDWKRAFTQNLPFFRWSVSCPERPIQRAGLSNAGRNGS
jgi:pimeloyl-ACP methyl ester carboxylesterase